jgi:hypothetical protein
MIKNLFVVLALGSMALVAQPLTWTLQGVTFSDGGTASGSFQYDAATQTYSNINITTTTGTVRTGATYHFFSSGLGPVPPASYVLVVTIGSGDPTGTPVLFLPFSAPGLTNSGGTVTLNVGQEASCANAGCNGPATPQRFTTAGSVVGSQTPPPATPAPTTSLLMLSGMAMIGFMAWRKQRKAYSGMRG